MRKQNKHIRLLLVSNFFPDHELNRSGGGIARYNEFLSNALSNHSHKITVLTFSETTRIEKVNNNLEIHRIHSNKLDKLVGLIQSRWSKIRYYRDLLRSYMFWKYYKKNLIQNRFDIIEFSDVNFPGYFFKSNIPHVIRMHGNHIYPLSCNSLYPNNKTPKAIIKAERYWFDNSLHFTYPSRSWKKLMTSKINLQNSMTHDVIYNPVDINEFRPIDNNDKLDFQIVTTERLEYGKGMDNVFKLIDFLAKNYNGNARFIFNIIGENRFKSNFNEPKTTSAIQVNYLGHLSKKDLIHTLQGSHLFIGPSRFETFSYSLFEAMSCALPVLVAKDHVYLEMVEENYNGWFYEQDNIEEMAKKLILLSEKKSLLIQAGKNARQFVINNASQDKIIPEILEFYNSIITK